MRDPLRSGSDPILTQMDEREIFTVLPNILIFNQKILEDLETRFKSWNPNQIQSQIVGDIFKNMVSFVELVSISIKVVFCIHFCRLLFDDDDDWEI